MLIIAFVIVAVLTTFELVSGDRLTVSRGANIVVWIARMALAFTLLPLVSLAVPYHLIDGRDLPPAVAIVLYLLVADLGEYLFHRAQHAVPFLWTLHALHHSDPDMNATTTERHFWGDQFIKAVTIWPAASLIVRPSTPALVAYMLLGLWNYVAHSKLPFSFGRLSWVLNSPAYHRRHHSALPEHHNSNFCGLIAAVGRPSRVVPATGFQRDASNRAWRRRSFVRADRHVAGNPTNDKTNRGASPLRQRSAQPRLVEWLPGPDSNRRPSD